MNDPYLIVIRNVIGEDIKVRVAPLLLRLQAFFIDYFIILQIQIFIGFLYLNLMIEYGEQSNNPYVSNIKIMLYILMNFAVQILYYLIQEYLWKGKTIGKKILNLRVVSTNGGAASLRNILIRNLVRTIEAGYLPIIGGIISFMHEKNQRLGDVMGSTYVIFEEPV